jgi:hypothetical protein
MKGSGLEGINGSFYTLLIRHKKDLSPGAILGNQFDNFRALQAAVLICRLGYNHHINGFRLESLQHTFEIRFFKHRKAVFRKQRIYSFLPIGSFVYDTYPDFPGIHGNQPSTLPLVKYNLNGSSAPVNAVKS